ncbi:AmmeMemoRadiSam system protein A [Olsenella sp. YH-ols2223]|uniref:AmmeMemoRadiSam system protein A n=1 Tax=Olsenella absiana TaxID=3115222 RepID=A0ABU7RA87_9ACTN
MAVLAAFVVPHPPLIVPEVGRGEERAIADTVAAYREVASRISALAPETLVVSTPHSVMYRDYNHVSPGAGASGSFARFGAPEARCSCAYDAPLRDELVRICEEEGLPAGTDHERDPGLDHATMIPLRFVWDAWPEGQAHPRVVRIGLSGLSAEAHYRLGRAVQRAAARTGRRVAFVASGDLSHKLKEDGPYGFAPEGPAFDERVGRDLSSGDLLDLLSIDRSLADRAAECGLRSFQIMAGALDGTEVSSELLSLEGPFGVGYAVAVLTPVGPEGASEGRRLLPRLEELGRARMAEVRAGEDALVSLARASLEAYVTGGRPAPLPEGLPAELLEARAGCFVSIKEDGELRGCIGTIAPTRASLAAEIASNAVAAGTRDPRFPPVRASELASLVYDVDVLRPSEPVESASELDPSRYGVIVSCDDGRRGLLLPDLDGIDTAEEQVSIAARKGGIDLARDSWRLERFEVVRHT